MPSTNQRQCKPITCHKPNSYIQWEEIRRFTGKALPSFVALARGVIFTKGRVATGFGGWIGRVRLENSGRDAQQEYLI